MLFSPPTLVIVADETPYDVHPRVGLRAHCTLTTLGVVIEIQTPGVWEIEDESLCPGHPIPDGHWVVGDYGEEELIQLGEIIAAIKGGE